MAYLLTFIEGILAFVSPCILPLLPVFMAHISGDESQSTRKRFINTLFFVLGFSTVFIILGATAFSFGNLLNSYRGLISCLAGLVMVFMGFVYLDIIQLPTFSNPTKPSGKSLLANYMFGISYSMAWTPCVGAFLGSAIALAGTRETLWQGVALLGCFSLGLGIPFIIFSLLYQKLTGFVSFLKKHSHTIRNIGGALLIVVGLLMVFDLLGYYYSIFN